MRIDDFGLERGEETTRVSARIAWEDAPRAEERLWIDAPATLPVRPSTDAFAAALYPLAMWTGEERMLVEGALCPRLVEGLTMVQSLFGSWYPQLRPVAVKPTRGMAPVRPTGSRVAGCFLSGGVDSLAVLRDNVLHVSRDHPQALRHALFVFGLNTHDFRDGEPVAERVAMYGRECQRLTALAATANAELIPLSTNLRSLYPDFEAWSSVGPAAGFASFANVLDDVIREMTLAGGVESPFATPHGSHPLLDHNFSTHAVALRLGQAGMTRLAKLRVLSAWPEGMRVVRSCLAIEPAREDRRNCGRCEKCLRTMLELHAIGALDTAVTFPRELLSPAALDNVFVSNPAVAVMWADLLPLLESSGESAYARGVRGIIARCNDAQPRARRGWLHRLRRR